MPLVTFVSRLFERHAPNRHIAMARVIGRRRVKCEEKRSHRENDQGSPLRLTMLASKQCSRFNPQASIADVANAHET